MYIVGLTSGDRLGLVMGKEIPLFKIRIKVKSCVWSYIL